MKIINGNDQHVGTEFFVLDLDTDGVEIIFSTQIDDVLISSPDGDVLMSWDMDQWDDSQCLLIKPFDNLKELGNLRCTKLMLKAVKPTKCYITVQRN